MHQLDSEGQRYTNAQVLEYLLRVENRTVLYTGSQVTAHDLIAQVAEQDPHITVLLDIGAQVLELENKDVAHVWLNQDTRSTVEAAVYCNSLDDDFYVLRRDGNVEPLQSSLYKTQLNKVLVYLDEARTRGTDFKFPIGTRAAVTLGPKLYKDKLVQGKSRRITALVPLMLCSSGCMRMRKLGSDHSVVFFASNEIRTKFQECIGVDKDELDSHDVLIWAMNETCTQIKDNGAHWATQGLNFDQRSSAWEKYSMGHLSPSELAKILREKESRTLEELYGFGSNDASFKWSAEDGPNERQKAIQGQCQELGISLSNNSMLLEEQERELAHEREEERQVERLPGNDPLEHSIDPVLRCFIVSGATSTNFLSLLDGLENTTIGPDIKSKSIIFFQTANLRVTQDFSRTIKVGNLARSMDDFLRPVRWILRSILNSHMLLLISPFEANELLPEIRKSKFVHLHVYSPRISRQVSSFEDLQFLVVPPPRYLTPPASQIIQKLNLFAGQLFFRDRAAFQTVCRMLGLHLGEIPRDLKGKVDAVGFVRDETARECLGIRECVFDASAILSLRELIGWRRKGKGFALTHVGQILHGNDIKESEFEQA